MKALHILQKEKAPVLLLLGANAVFLIILIVYASREPWITNIDPAAYAVLARNIAEGKGYTADYIWVFYREFSSLSHPEDSWPPLQPLFIAFFFRILGPTIFAFRLPSIFFFICASVGTYWLTSRYFGKWAGLFSGLLILFDSRLVNLAGPYCFNDLGFAAISIFTMVFIWEGIEEEKRESGIYNAILAGFFTSLAILQKLQGILFVILYLLWSVVRLKKGGVSRAFTRLVFFYLAMLPLCGWLVLHNLKAFGTPFFPSNYPMNVSCAEWEPPFVWWNNRRILGKIYFDDPPTYRKLIKKHGAVKILIKNPMNRLRQMIRGFTRLKIIDGKVLLLAAFGILLNVKKKRGFLLFLAFIVPLSSIYVIFSHYETRYYYFLKPLAAALGGSCIAITVEWLFRRRMRVVALAFLATLLSIFTLHHPFFPASERSYLWFKSFNVNTHQENFDKMIQWVKDNTAPEDAFMAYSSFDVAFYARRKTLWIPNAPYDEVAAMARRYGVRYLLLDNLNTHSRILHRRIEGKDYQDYHYTWMRDLYLGKEVAGFKEVLDLPGSYRIYEVPWAKER